ncbi:hypothetical protein H8959_012390 [Pygathrix nigripes]
MEQLQGAWDRAGTAGEGKQGRNAASVPALEYLGDASQVASPESCTGTQSGRAHPQGHIPVVTEQIPSCLSKALWYLLAVGASRFCCPESPPGRKSHFPEAAALPGSPGHVERPLREATWTRSGAGPKTQQTVPGLVQASGEAALRFTEANVPESLRLKFPHVQTRGHRGAWVQLPVLSRHTASAQEWLAMSVCQDLSLPRGTGEGAPSIRGSQRSGDPSLGFTDMVYIQRETQQPQGHLPGSRVSEALSAVPRAQDTSAGILTLDAHFPPGSKRPSSLHQDWGLETAARPPGARPRSVACRGRRRPHPRGPQGAGGESSAGQGAGLRLSRCRRRRSPGAAHALPPPPARTRPRLRPRPAPSCHRLSGPRAQLLLRPGSAPAACSSRGGGDGGGCEMVDAGGRAAAEGWRKMEAPPDGAADLVPLDRYDAARAKIAANLQWICAKAYGRDNIPEDLRDPFYVDQYEQEHIKPPVIKLLLSSELYCRVCSLILKGDQVAALQGHQSVIQALSRKGIYVMESDDTPVTESDLSRAPIKMSAHMAMVDALMMAYTVEMISIEKVVASVKRFSTFSASKELPYDLEDAMVFWINKVNLKMREITEKEVKLKQQLLESPAHQKVRYRREHLSARQSPYFPLLEDLMRDGSDGAALLAVVHYYCPEQMKLDDICLKEVTSMADSLYNIRLLREFSNEYLNKCFYLTLEDMLYAPLVLKPNVMVFIAELFWWFENVKPDFVQPRDVQELKDAKTVLHQKSSRPPVPISNATKRSFLGSPAAGTPADLQPPAQLPAEGCHRHYLHPEEPEYLGKGTAAFSPSHPLLPLRQKQQKSIQGEDIPDQRHRSNSLTRVDGQPRGAAIAWPEKKTRPASQPTPFALHHAASCEVDPSSGDSISLARSISKDSLASNVVNLTPQNQPHPTATKTPGKSLLNNVSIEDEEEELVAIVRADMAPQQADLEFPRASPRASGLIASARSPQGQLDTSESKPDSFFLEPLMPAVLKPAKEKQVITKEDERGEGRPRSITSRRPSEGPQPLVRRKVTGSRDLNRTFTPIPCSEFPMGIDPTETGPQSVETMGEVCGGASGPWRIRSIPPGTIHRWLLPSCRQG